MSSAPESRTPGPLVFSGEPPWAFVWDLLCLLALEFGATAAEAQELGARLKAGVPAPDDIAEIHEEWSCGRLRFTRDSDWDWHDLRGIYSRSIEIRAVAEGMPPGEHLRAETKGFAFEVSVLLRPPLDGRVLQILRAAEAEERERATGKVLAPFALQP